MDEQLEKELQLGSEAQQLIESPVFRDVMKAVEKELNDLLLNIPTTQPDLCTDLIRRIQVFEAIKMKIRNVVNTGKLAQQSIEESEPYKPEFNRGY